MHPKIGILIRNGNPVYYFFIKKNCMEFYSKEAAQFYANKVFGKG